MALFEPSFSNVPESSALLKSGLNDLKEGTKDVNEDATYHKNFDAAFDGGGEQGKNLVHLIDREDESYCFRLHKDRVFYASETSMRLAASISRPNLMSFGTVLGKFNKSGKFKLHITALDYLARYAKFKIWIKPNGEMPFLYGNHVVKAHLGRITEDTPEHQGVVVYSMNDTPLGFGVTARSTIDTRKLDPTAIIVFHQADVGEYLRDEDTLF